MMRVAFFHDARLKVDKQNIYYTDGGLTSGLFRKYLELCDSLIVVTRKESIDSKIAASRSISSCAGVTFNCLKRLNLKSLILGEDRILINDTVTKTDFAIIRMPSIIGIFAYLECRRQHKPYLIEMVGCPWDSLWYYGKIKYKFAAPILYLVNRYIVWTAPYVRYVSAKFLQSRYPTKGRQCACSDVQLNIFEQSVVDKRIALIRKTNGMKVAIGTVAPLHVSYKGQRYVIEAMGQLSKQGYDIDYYLVGGGDATKLINLAKKLGLSDKVHFMGLLPHDKVFKFMQGIDLYIQPSNAEVIARVILEAFSVACPVVGSSSGGTPELIDRQYVFVRKNVKDLEEKIKKIVGGNLESQAKRNYLEANKYNPGLLDARMYSFYSQAIARETRGRIV